MRKIYLLLTAAMLLIGSSTLWAAGHEAPQVEGDVASIEYKDVTTYYDNIADALTDWKTSEKNTNVTDKLLTLLSDCEYTSGATFTLNTSSSNKNTHHKLDLNGHKLTWNFPCTKPVTTNKSALEVTKYSTLTIVDESSDKTGGINFKATNVLAKFCGLKLFDSNSNVSAEIKGGTFSATNSDGEASSLYLKSQIKDNIAISDNARFNGVYVYDHNSYTPNAKQCLNGNENGNSRGGLYYPRPEFEYVEPGYVYEQTTEEVEGELGKYYYKIVKAESGSSYIAIVDGDVYTNTDDIWALDKDVTVQILQSSAEAPFIIPSTFNHTVTISAENDLFIENSGNVKFATDGFASLNLTNNGTAAFDGGTFNYPVINNSGNVTIASACKFKLDETTGLFSGTGKFTFSVNSTVSEVAYKQLKELDVVLPDATKWCVEGVIQDTKTRKYLPDYYKVVLDKDIVATVGSEYYTKLDEAARVSSNDNTPVVLYANHDGDITFNSYTNLDSDVHIEMNGKNITSSINCYFYQVKGLLKITNEKTSGGVIHSSRGCSLTECQSVIRIYGRDENDGTTGLYIGKNVTIENQGDGYGITILNKQSGNKKCYGVTVNIEGSVFANVGIAINGTVTEGTPEITIANDAVLKGYGDAANCPNEACIYAAGYGIWNIGAATLKAGTPIYAKSGEININGATIEACGEYAAPVANSGGFNPTGDAIIIDSHEDYAGNVTLSVYGNSTVTSKNGYAIQEALTKMDESKAIGLTIEGGSFAGAKGTVKLSDEFAQALIDGSDASGNWKLNGVTSGKYTAKPEVVADGYEVVVTSDAQFPYSVKRMTEPIIPQESTEYITENTTIATVRTVGTTVEDKFAVVVKSGVTYEVEGMVVGNNAETEAKVVVEPGATLIVGASGIITHKAGNLILKADKEHGTAKLIFKDANSANTNPLATVELYLRARTVDAEAKTQLWQHYGLPVSYDEGLTSVEKNFGVNYNNWIVGKGWKYVTGDDMLSQGAWAGHNITTNASVEGSVIRFKGQLIGRDNKGLDFVPGYSCFTNSYTAPLSLRSLRSKLNASGVADPTIWIYDVSYAPTFRFVNNSFKDTEFLDKGIAAMQAYFIPSEANGHSLTIDYDNDVIGFNNGSVKDAEVSEYNGGTIVLSDGFNESEVIITEGDDFSDAFDRGWDANLMEGVIPAIYVADGSAKYASFATNAIEGKKISIMTNNSTEYSLSFKFLEGKAFKLKDLASGAEVEVSAENVYRFTAEANSTIERFELIEGSVAANETDADAIKIWVANEALNIAGAAEGDAIEVINLAGVKVLSATATGETVQSISLSGIASGAYIVKAGAATVKVIK